MGLQHADQVPQCQAGVENVLHQNDVASFHGAVHVLQHSHFATLMFGVAVARHRDEVEVSSSLICRARSARKMVAPLSTPISITDSPVKSAVMWSPISTTFAAICSRVIRTLSLSKEFLRGCSLLVYSSKFKFQSNADCSLPTASTSVWRETGTQNYLLECAYEA